MSVLRIKAFTPVWLVSQLFLATAWPAQMVMDTDDAETLIATGWRFVGIWSNGKIVLERRNPNPQ